MKHISISLLFLLCSACAGGGKPTEQAVATAETDLSEAIKPLSPLEPGVVDYGKTDPFPKTIELKGKQLVADTVTTRLSGTELIIKENRLVWQNRKEPFRVLRLPSMKVAASFGEWGVGPDEFLYPSLVTAVDTSLLCYIFERGNYNLYKLTKKLTLEKCFSPFRPAIQRQWGSHSSIYEIEPGKFMYVDHTPAGQSIMQVETVGDSGVIKELYNLALSTKQKSWQAYMGVMAVNPKLNRAIYAYKFFRQLKFMNLACDTVKTVSFQGIDYDDKTLGMADGMDFNVTNYWIICGQEKYVYVYYIGQTPHVIYRENKKGIYYCYIEQYDWNGNPIRRYKLDQFGYFTMDEKNKKLYLASDSYDDPFFVYDLPE